MVGVPGRSKACHNCRRRRIKCGSERPGCHNCAKSQRTCSGYQRQHAFIMWSHSSNVTSSLPKGRAPDVDEPGPGLVMLSRWRADGTGPHTRTPSPKDILSPYQVAVATRDFSSVNSISSKNIFRDRFFSLFIENALSFDDNMKLAFGERNNWMVHVVNLPSMTPALEDALLAFCTARVGRLAGQPALLQESLKLYTKSLAGMRQNILWASGTDHEQNITACMSLLLYEIAECPGGTTDGYIAHYNGTMQLLRMQGPAAYTSGLAHSVFVMLRLHTVLQDFKGPRRHFLTDPEWRDIPWTNPATKTSFDLLLDILLEMPGLSGQLREMESTTDAQEILRHAVRSMENGHKMESDLGRWMARLKTTSPGPLYLPRLSKLDSAVDNADQGKLFPVAFHFPTFMHGQNMVYYWLALVRVHAHLCLTHQILAEVVVMLDAMDRTELPCSCRGGGSKEDATQTSHKQCLQHFTIGSVPPLGQRADWPRTTAYSICQSIEFFLQGGMRGLASPSVIPPLTIVKGFWQHESGDWSRQMAWMDDMLDRIHANGSGITGTLAKLKL